LQSRPEGREILHDARLRRLDQLLVYKLDRLGRETRLTLDAVAELESWRIDYIPGVGAIGTEEIHGITKL
jgi:DNA invertase Pin-like site-specific DNA recombinase